MAELDFVFESDEDAVASGRSGVRTVSMSVDEWIRIPPYPGQRDTEGRLRRALRYLGRPLESHAQVSMAVFPDGWRCMLDGHTRSLAWRLGLIPRPERLWVSVYPVRNRNHARDLYNSFDNPMAADSASDYVFGALNESGILKKLKSPYLRSGRYMRALCMASGLEKNDVLKAVNMFSGPLILLDDINPRRALFQTFVLAPALMDLMACGQSGVSFWRVYNDKQGTKTDRGYDAAELLYQMVKTRSSRPMAERDSHLCHLVLRIVHWYRENPNRRWKNVPASGMSPREFADYYGIPFGG